MKANGVHISCERLRRKKDFYDIVLIEIIRQKKHELQVLDTPVYFFEFLEIPEIVQHLQVALV